MRPPSTLTAVHKRPPLGIRAAFLQASPQGPCSISAGSLGVSGVRPAVIVRLYMGPSQASLRIPCGSDAASVCVRFRLEEASHRPPTYYH